MFSSRFCKTSILFFIWFLLFVTTLTLASTDVDQIRSAIQASGSNWIAGENWVTRLTPARRRKLCGTIHTPPESGVIKLLEIPQTGELPAQFDWRDNGGTNWVTPVRDQGECGSCWDFSAMAQVESWWLIKNNRPDTTLDLSEQFVLSCGDGSCDEGWPIEDALDFIATYGVPSEACMPYLADDTVPCDNACSGWEDHSFTIPGWGYVTTDFHNIENLKAAILRHPVTAILTVYTDFYFYSGGVYEHVSGAAVDPHGILIVGWNDEEQSWLCKNSWGTDWGENGYFRIKWGNSGIGRYCTFIWDDEADNNSLFIASVNQTVNIPRGQNGTAQINITNNGVQPLQYSAVPFELPIAFHQDSFEAFDNSSWWCGIATYNGYANHWLQYLDTPVLDLSATNSPVLAFNAKWEVEDMAGSQSPYDSWDGCNVWISVDGGKNFEVLEATSPAYNSRNNWAFGHPDKGWNMGLGIPAWGGDSNGWQFISIPIEAYRSPEVVVRFAFASDMAYSSVNAPEMNGFFVDEVHITDASAALFAEHGDSDSPMVATGFGENKAYWLTLSNTNEILLPGQSITMTAEISTTNLTPGKYAGQIFFFTNEKKTEELAATLNVNVLPLAHDLRISEPPVVSEIIAIMESVPLLIEIENLGQNDEQQVAVECQLMANGQAVYTGIMTLPLIQTNQSIPVEFPTFDALITGPVTGTITILNDDDYPVDNATEFNFTVTNILDDFETDLSLWLNSGTWGLVGSMGRNCLHVTNGENPYPNNLDQSLQYIAPLTLNLSNLDSAALSYSCWSYTNITDSCFLEVSSDETNWTKIDAVTGTISNWEERRIDLTSRIANTDELWFRFRFVSDAADNSFGVLLDDIKFLAVPGNPSSDVTDTPGITLPEKFTLAQNYPNPFNMSTRINYSLPETGLVAIRIFNLQGRLVRQLENRIQTAGIHETSWNGLDANGHEISSGVYVCHLVVNGKPVQNRKMLLLK